MSEVTPTLNLIKEALAAGKLLPEAVKHLTEWLDGSFLPAWARESIEELVKQKAL